MTLPNDPKLPRRAPDTRTKSSRGGKPGTVLPVRVLDGRLCVLTARLSGGATKRLAHLPSRTGNACRS
jgi:hypothetical protein